MSSTDNILDEKLDGKIIKKENIILPSQAVPQPGSDGVCTESTASKGKVERVGGGDGAHTKDAGGGGDVRTESSTTGTDSVQTKSDTVGTGNAHTKGDTTDGDSVRKPDLVKNSEDGVNDDGEGGVSVSGESDGGDTEGSDTPITSLLPSKEEFARTKKLMEDKKSDRVRVDIQKDGTAQKQNRMKDAVPAQNKTHTKGATDTKSEKNKKQKEKGVTVPVLRTLQGDSADIAYTTSGAEVRKILAVEMEKKKKEQEEYLRKTKEMLKESAILKEKQRDFTKKRKRGGKDDGKNNLKKKDADTKKDANTMTSSVIGALNYAKRAKLNLESPNTPAPAHGNAGDGTEQKKQHIKKKEVRDAARKVQHGAVGADMSSRKNDPATKEIRPDKKGEEVPNVSSISKSMDAMPQQKNRPGLINTLRKSIGLQKTTSIDEEQREILKKKQEEAVEKEGMRKAWKEFETKKEELREAGLKARDIRTYDTNIKPNKKIRQQNTVAIFAVLLILAALISTVVYVATRPNETVSGTPTEDVYSVSDIINSEGQVSVEVLSSPGEWGQITQTGGSKHSVIKFIPFEMIGSKSVQFDISSFFSVFNVSIPERLKKSLGDYYFVGRYTGETTTSGIFITTVDRYGDALSWMLGWESDAINAFSEVFPNTVVKSNPGNTTVETKIIDNKDVRILTNARSDAKIFYYFFNRSVLVFIVGEESAIEQINNRIRSTNAKPKPGGVSEGDDGGE